MYKNERVTRRYNEPFKLIYNFKQIYKNENINKSCNTYFCLISFYSNCNIYISLQLYKTVNIRYFSNTAEGEITGYYTKKAHARFQKYRTPVYAPTFSFIDDKNEEIKVVTQVFIDTMKYKKGEIVTVYYNPNNPKKAYLNDSFPWMGRLVLLFFGVCGLFFTIPPILNKRTY
ncbi:DUF3592 domain-containing protein [Zobellia roscoffensis]|uniref:DUF3592 domain-containing protein n=1 Tax=Zobellia roscoffensis TaxID=2779508 RepID=UPI00188D95FC|nr:DUF3592 domain-containing protein [Zobellia roscoffensis]